MKNLFKSTLAVLLALAMLIPGGAVFAKEPVDFTDVDADDWFAPYVDYCSVNGLVNGMTATTFEPNTSLSRAMFVTILCRSMKAYAPEGAEMPFTDVPENHWAKDAILWAYNAGIVNGMTPTTFAPDGLITREQMCTIICRFADSAGYDIPMAEGYGIFADEDEISDWAYDSVFVCYAAGIVNGITEDSFGPSQNATRAQACAILQRFYRLVTHEYNESEEQDGKVTFTESDKFGVYATGYYLYDENGNQLEYYYEEAGFNKKVEYKYNELDLLIEIKYVDSDGYETLSVNTYDENGSLLTNKYTTSDGYSDETTHEYDESGRMTESTYSDSDGYSNTENYAYDEMDNIIGYRFANSEGYWYDEEFEYDGKGNLLKHKYEDSDGYEYTETYAYNEDEEKTEYSFVDSVGYTESEKYTYEGGRLVKAVKKNSDGVDVEIDMEYKGGNLVSAKKKDGGQPVIDITQKFNEDDYISEFVIKEYTDGRDDYMIIRFGESGEYSSAEYFDSKYNEETGVGATYYFDENSFNGPDGAPSHFKHKIALEDYAMQNVTFDYDEGTVSVTDAYGGNFDTIDSNLGQSMLLPALAVQGFAQYIAPMYDTDVLFYFF